MQKFFLIFSIAFFTALAGVNAAETEADRPPCQPFRIHAGANPPYHWEKLPGSSGISPQREAALLKKISKLPTYGSFLDSYLPWKEEQKSLPKRVLRLECIYFYAKHDTDGDGIPDWSAQTDRRPSSVLYPQDEDIDGDGTPNLLDPAPFDRKIKGDGKKIPAHLVSAEKKLQAEIMEKYGILAIDHSDAHSPEVLGNFLFLLDHGLPRDFTKSLKSFRYLYAFSGHDREVDIAAYHLVAKAISIGGIHTFPSASPTIPNPKIIAALAHEIGHALLMEKTSASELTELAAKFGRWNPEKGKDLYGAEFFRPHPLYSLLRGKKGREPASESKPNLTDLVSSYAATNMHEWFAESFAASVMVSMGEQGLLGKSWRSSLITIPKSRRYHWVNYNNISPALREWFGRKVNSLMPNAGAY